MLKTRLLLAAFLSALFIFPARAAEPASPRVRLLMDFGWRFALGHPYDTDKDYDHGTAYFSYFAKTGNGDGPASPKFDERAWRVLNLPHDWAVETPFDGMGSFSHGYKAMGRRFPDASVGWYRKTFLVPESDKGRRLSLEFDGIHRDAQVWVNGFYMGRESSGYSRVRYDITDVLNYGGTNVVAVRMDATLEEGWFYEGAGIYRHVWLTKTGPLHVADSGIFVTATVGDDAAEVTARAEMVQEGAEETSFEIDQRILDEAGKTVAQGREEGLRLAPGDSSVVTTQVRVAAPKLWSVDTPVLYKLVTTVKAGNRVVDRVETPFGIRAIEFDPDKGFFLNGKRLTLKGANNHQDHAGVGTAIPDSLQDFRVARLKEIGCNAYRCSHNPPAIELLDACDRLGMLVIVENRLMVTSPEVMDRLRRMVRLYRNHPSVIAWSVGNEEWAIEGNVKGVQITEPMQRFVKKLDPTRYVTAASSGGWGQGISIPIELMGFNYLVHGNIDEYHAKFPQRPSLASEETTTHQTRGVYEDDPSKCHMAPDDLKDPEKGIQKILKYYATRPYVAGIFLWTGFDYRGEENPFEFPAIASVFGFLDLCGFPKDCAYYLRAWWNEKPVVILSPHWNWKGKEGQTLDVRVFSNCAEVELRLNGKSLGKKPVPSLSRLDWRVPYEPGVLEARGFRDGKETASDRRETAGDPASVALVADRSQIRADGEDVSVVTIEARDARGRRVPTADNPILFSVEGPGKIIGVGNGDPSCHEPDKYFETVSQVRITDLRMLDGGTRENRPEVGFDVDATQWPVLFSGRRGDQGFPSKDKPAVRVVRGSFDLPRLEEYSEIVLLPKSLVDGQAVYVNGHFIAGKIGREDPVKAYPLPKSILKKGRNVYAVVGIELMRRWKWEELNLDPGCLRTVIPAGQWKRSLFSGLAQVIVQSEKKPGAIILKAASKGLKPAALRIQSERTTLRPFVPE